MLRQMLLAGTERPHASRALEQMTRSTGSCSLFLCWGSTPHHNASLLFSDTATNHIVLSAFLRNGAAYIVMEKIEGQELAKLWHHISDETRLNLLGQLRQIVDELRALETPSEFSVGSCTGGSLQDFRQSRAPPPVRFGPFRTIQDFHSWLRDGLKQGEAENMEQADLNSVNEMIARQDGPWPPPVFTHGDLNPSNILVRDDKIVGIIDWEMSGWYPHYWEYTSLKIGSYLVNPAWDENIDKFLSPFPDDLKMEKVRFRWWGNIC
ncbi:hypothetical protein N8I77_005450 [Diaporthe amygdali]|uniref:Aminoglycoside phosphotransferase domain-containing protein n=1 Tax=Phomopsis amygdali TaxID=1214568 RepID=A0AAD9SE07_PHOAM|nr:hypothetical protein N8I77_005450 [Diaporthe amygdali]